MIHLSNEQELIKLIFSLLVHIGVPILISYTLVSTLNLIQPENQKLSKWLIWLNVVLEPITSFFVVRGMSKSIENELRQRNFEEEKNPALAAGLTYAILSIIAYIGFFLVLNNFVPTYFNQIVVLVYFSKVFFMVKFWSKITWYKRIFEDKSITDYTEVAEIEND